MQPAELDLDLRMPDHRAESEFSIAFQPIVDVRARKVVSFEALVRGPQGESAEAVFARVPRDRLLGFDQACRLKAIGMAARLNLRASLNLNFFPGAFPRSATYLQGTLRACWQAGLPVERLVFEVTESEALQSGAGPHDVFQHYAQYGFQTAIDDFGKGLSGLRQLARYRPDFVKLDRNLICDIDTQWGKQLVVRAIRDLCHQLDVELVAEGVETVHEYRWLQAVGIHFLQGFYFAQPAFEALVEVEPSVF